MKKYIIKFKKLRDGSYHIYTLNEDLKRIFEDLAKFGYSFISNSDLARAFGIYFKDLRRMGVVKMAWDKHSYMTIIALPYNYNLKKDKNRENRFILSSFSKD